MPSSQHSGNRATYTTGVHIHKQQLPWQTGVRDRHGGLSCDHLSIGSECKALTAYSIVRCEDQGRCGGGLPPPLSVGTAIRVGEDSSAFSEVPLAHFPPDRTGFTCVATAYPSCRDRSSSLHKPFQPYVGSY